MVGEKMREILFRGKRLGSKKWVYGCLLDAKEDTYIIPHGYEYLYDEQEKLAFNVERRIVVRKTVGQYTGLNDKNGTRIFEGDIVRYELSAYGKSLTKDYEIVFHNYSWGCKNEKGNISRLDLFEPSLLEVKGNKHER